MTSNPATPTHNDSKDISAFSISLKLSVLRVLHFIIQVMLGFFVVFFSVNAEWGEV